MKADYYPKHPLKQNDNKIPGPGACITNYYIDSYQQKYMKESKSSIFAK